MPEFSLVKNGKPEFGRLSHPVDRINYMDFDLRSSMDGRRSDLWKKLAFNQFQFIGFADEALIGGVAIVDLKWLGNAFAYIYDINNNALSEFSFINPMAVGTHISDMPDQGESRFSQWSRRFSVRGDANGKGRRIHVSIPRQLDIELDLVASAHYQPLRVCSPAGYNGWVYTQKAAGLAARGSIHVGGREHVLDASASGSYDFSCGYMRRETAWNWSCFSGFSKDNRRIGLNLAAGVNETGVTENAFWIGEHYVPLGPARFQFDRYNPQSNWLVTTDDERLELFFEPAGLRREKIDALVIASNFKQFFGRYRGRLKSPDGEVVEFENVWGYAEDHYAKW